jgi:anion-transporting  ArsA/GET3 family ATPase
MKYDGTRSVILPQEDVLKRRFHLVTGKGGVGKSTVSMTLGLAFAQRGLRTLICEIDHREMMTRAFRVPPSRGAVRHLNEHLAVVSIDTQSALSEYGALKLKVKALSSLLTENPITRALVSIVPGVADLIALGKAFNHEREKDQQGYIWDRVIVDAPSTGHGLTFIRLPQVIRDVVPSGNMRREADEMWSLLSDQTRAAIHVVTTTEDLPTQEALELWRALTHDVGLSPQALWINMSEALPFTDQEWTALLRLKEERESNLNETASCRAMMYLERRQHGIQSQRQHLDRLSQIKTPRAIIPRVNSNHPHVLCDAIADQLKSHPDEEVR